MNLTNLKPECLKTGSKLADISLIRELHRESILGSTRCENLEAHGVNQDTTRKSVSFLGEKKYKLKNPKYSYSSSEKQAFSWQNDRQQCSQQDRPVLYVSLGFLKWLPKPQPETLKVTMGTHPFFNIITPLTGCSSESSVL